MLGITSHIGIVNISNFLEGFDVKAVHTVPFVFRTVRTLPGRLFWPIRKDLFLTRIQ